MPFFLPSRTTGRHGQASVWSSSAALPGPERSPIGASAWQTFRYVMLPALRGGLFTGALLTFAHSLGEFGATVLVSGNMRLRTQTAPLYIFAQFEAGNIAAANAVAAVLAVLSLAVFFFLLRYTGRPAARGA